MKLDQCLEIRTHRDTGNLARFTRAVAGVGGLIEEMETLHIGKEYILRKVTIEAHASRAGVPGGFRAGRELTRPAHSNSVNLPPSKPARVAAFA